MSKKRRNSIFNDPAMKPMRMQSRAGKETTNQNLILQKLESQYQGDTGRGSRDAQRPRFDSATDAQIQQYLGAIQAAEMPGANAGGAAGKQRSGSQTGPPPSSQGLSRREVQNMMMRERLRSEMRVIEQMIAFEKLPLHA